MPPVVQRAAGILVTGTLARDSMIARGAAPERVHLFANTVDVEDFAMRAEWLHDRRDELRRGIGAHDSDVVVLCVARLGPEKRLDVLVRAVAAADEPSLLLALAGDGPERQELVQLAGELGVRLALLGDVDWERIVELYVAPTCSRSSRSARPGLWSSTRPQPARSRSCSRNGSARRTTSSATARTARLSRPATSLAPANALRDLARDPELRRAQGARSRELARDWGYGPSVDGFLDAVREAVVD